MQTWYCSVRLALEADARPGRPHERAAQARALSGLLRLLPLRLLEARDQVVVLQVPRGRDDDVSCLVHRLVVGRQRAAADGRDHVGGSDHGPAERMVAEDRLAHQVVHELVRRVLVHRDLLEHDLALGVEIREERRVDHVAHHVERLLQVVVGDADVDEGVLARGGRVQLAAQPVEDLGDVLRRVGARAFEQQMLDEMREAGSRGRLVARAGADPEAEGDRAHARDPLGDHALARNRARSGRTSARADRSLWLAPGGLCEATVLDSLSS